MIYSLAVAKGVVFYIRLQILLTISNSVLVVLESWSLYSGDLVIAYELSVSTSCIRLAFGDVESANYRCRKYQL